MTYGTAKDQMSKEATMDRSMTVLGLCFDNLKEGDRSAYNVAMHEFMVDHNSCDDPRVTPKVQHQEAWQSPEALVQFAIDTYGAHKPEGLGHNAHLNFRPMVFNKPVAAALKINQTEFDDIGRSLRSPLPSDLFLHSESELYGPTQMRGKAPYRNLVVTDARHCTTRSQQPVLLFRLFEDSSRRSNELLAPRASRPLAVLASMTRRHVRRLRLAARHSAATTPPTRRRQATVIPTPVAPALRTTSNALPTDLGNASSCHPVPSQL